MRSCDARICILNIIGGQLLERWPPTFMEKLFGTHEFSYKDRMEMGTFLYGNVRDTNLVYYAVCERLGSDPKHHDHMRRWLANIASGKCDDRYYYGTSTCSMETGFFSAALSMQVGGCPARVRAF
jgi:hypothetical protein